jgi:hypothetical protein
MTSSKFDKYFSNIINKDIINKASRYYRRLSDIDDLIYDKYFSKFGDKSVFEAVVLTNVNTTSVAGNGAENQYLPIRVRITDIHTNILPDPFKITDVTEDNLVKKQNEFRNLIASHPVAYPDTQVLANSAAADGLGMGAIVEVYFSQQGPRIDGRQRGLKYRKVIKASGTRTIRSDFASILGTMSTSTTTTVGDGGGIANPAIFRGQPALLGLTEGLVAILAGAGYNEEITITSAVRDAAGQVRAMMANLFQNNGAGPQWASSASTWVQQYRDTGVKSLVVLRHRENQARDAFKAELTTYVTANLMEISPHGSGMAIDIATKGKDFANIEIMKRGLEAAKTALLVKYFKWEYDAAPLEHMHVTFEGLENE